jgi:hypothetical protein
VFSIFLSKGFGLDFLKIIGKKISRRSKSNNNNKSRRRRKAWELTRWWECA